ncbi:ribonucleoside-diphosphate reductase alpha chain [Paenibacillus peoriae]|uniref:Ribonucleoside-diphosphate reductase n=1 Tax=Paenibacillus peoriae TaxID=59893 RepID=A0ABU1QIV6_9BACL|nr:class 1b ribonucleoside-diphosphate reductase subunit alpha [Paenibacillus peoriae]MDR6779530.1 ribonucleoside-diphosphate reductase alpha chain [Paenibacillus peoriae]
MKYLELNNLIMKKKDGFFDLEKDLEAIKEFKKEVIKNTVHFNNNEERMKHLIENDYYIDFYEHYSKEEVNKIHEIAYSYKFKFASYMAIQKFYNDYALKTNDKNSYLEDIEQHNCVVAMYLAQGQYEVAVNILKGLMEQRIQPSTPTYLNAGRSRRGEMVSCFLLEMDDSLNSINYVLNTCMQLSKIGGGVAVNLSKLRGRGEPIKGVEGAAKGISPVLKLMEDAFSYADQMGQRKGSGAGYYNIFGWDVQEFLDSKKINADEKSRLKTLSIGLIVPQKFYELAEQDKPLYVFAPYSVYKTYGIHLDDMNMNEMYEELLNNQSIKKKRLDARDMITKIAVSQLESGYPYIVNRDNANSTHALKGIGNIKMSNLCTEIFQLQETSEINDYGQVDIIRKDISCNLASLNIVNVMESKNIKESVYTGIYAIDSVSRLTSIGNAPGVKLANDELHSVGLGAMNLHGFLAKNRIAYESSEAIEFVRAFFAAMNFHSLEASMELSKKHGSFKGFEFSEYANGNYFVQYEKEDFNPASEKISKLFEGINLPTKKDWTKLKAQVAEFGLANAYRLTIAPTQSISYVQNSTSSVMPIVEPIETRTYANSTTYYPMPFLARDNFFFYKSAYNMDMFKMIDLISEIQRHIDQGVSTILYVNSDVSTKELGRYYVYANRKGLKSLYYTRTKKLSVEECTSCAI